MFFRPSVFRESISEFILLTVLAVLKMKSILVFFESYFFHRIDLFRAPS